MVRKFKYILTVALIAILAVSAIGAFAAVNFDPSTGTGFVGKGDVQLVFGWNNQALQANASGVTFSYNATDTYSAVCTWITGEGTRGEQTHDVTHSTSTVVNSAVVYEARKNKQLDITGFNLTGLGATTETGTVPVVGGPCPGNAGTDGTWTSVTLASSTGGLYVNYGGTSVAMPNTPVVIVTP
jgi:hypothetical protein